MAGLNLNPKKEENNFQTNDIETMLERICKKTYLIKSGWDIIRKQNLFGSQPAESICEYKKGKKTPFTSQKYIFSHAQPKLRFLAPTHRHWRLSFSNWQNRFSPNDAR